MKIIPAKIATEYTKFEGGLDLKSPPITVSPGSLLAGMNYECDTNGGYSRIDGYERYDGQASPSDAAYVYLGVTFSDTVEVDDIITGSDSGATGVVIVSGTDHLCVTKVTDTFEGEAFTVGGAEKGTITSVLSGEVDGYDDAIATSLAADEYRGDISAPPGSGAIRGLALLGGTLYCFRDNAGGTAGLIYKATASGWSAITLYHELSFDTGIAQVFDGNAITQLTSGATATVKRVVLESGTWGSTAAGRLILSGISGTFDATHDIQVAAATKVTSTSLATQIAILPGGRYETVVYNFTGSTDTKRIYGADGVNRGFEFDGDVYVPIDTGMTTDTPEYVSAHKKQLFFSFMSSSQNSGIGTPYEWTPVSGASEIAIGDDITGYAELQGQVLAIFAKNISEQLIGSDSDDYVLDSISNEIGCIPRTVQRIGHVYIMDSRGIIDVFPTDVYGNFYQNTISRSVQPIIDAMRLVVTASSVYKSRNQYRLYGSDGTGICMTVLDNNRVAFTSFYYPDNVSCTVSGEDENGNDVVFFGSDEGMVYQADRGSSFDGEDIEAFVMLHFNNSKSPSVLKTYRKALIEMSSTRYSYLRYSPEISYGDPNIPSHTMKEIATQGAGGFWDIAIWDEFFYDSQLISTPEFYIEGTGTNLSLTIYSKNNYDLGHRLDGAILHYTPRRTVS